ncbi:MAG TPA: NifU family protein [Acidimicrobiia bacterium]|nr:NifU family protein [Acidimicrobiia bacterium]
MSETQEETTGIDPRKSGVLAALEVIRPALQSDGGDITFVGIDEDSVVHVHLTGACGDCSVSTMTLKAGVERIVMDRVPGITAVVNDGEMSPEEEHAAV